MSQDPIETLIRDYYLSSSLSAQRVDAIQRESSRQISKPLTSRPWVPWEVTVASFSAVAVIMIALRIGALQIETSFFERVGAEVLFNYQKSRQRNIYVTPQLSELSVRMPRLDFSIEDLPPRVMEGFVLVGGRYCSLRGVLAAQLRLTQRSDQRSGVLYVARRTGDLERIRETDVAIGDFKIEFWHDDERAFVLTIEPPGMHHPKMHGEIDLVETSGPEKL